MTLTDDLTTLREATLKHVPVGIRPTANDCLSALGRVEADIARLERDLERAMTAAEEALEKGSTAANGWQQAGEKIARLQDGLRFYADEADYLRRGSERGTIQRDDRGAHARALLSDQDRAA